MTEGYAGYADGVIDLTSDHATSNTSMDLFEYTQSAKTAETSSLVCCYWVVLIAQRTLELTISADPQCHPWSG